MSGHAMNRARKTFTAALRPILGAVFAGIAAFTASAAPVAAQGSDVVINRGGDRQSSRTLTLALDKAVIIELPQAASDVLISNPAKVDAVIRSPRRVYLLGLEAGQANAFFFDSRGEQILNLEILIERDTAGLDSLLKKLMPDARITVDTVNANVILKGSVQTSSDASRAQDVAARYVGDPDLVMNMLSIRDQNQVMLKVRIVEMQRRLVKQLGVNGSAFARLDDAILNTSWTSSFAASGSALGGIDADIVTNGIGDITDLDFMFNAFEQNGMIKTLAEPTLNSLSGEAATFLAGGEFPVPVGQDDGQVTIEFKKFGVSLGFRPVVLSKDRINLAIDTEVSEISRANSFTLGSGTTIDPDTGNPTVSSVLTIPGLTVRRVSNVVELPSGGSMAIAGLLQENIQTAVEGVPGLKDVSVLGQLFRSNEFINQETELVVIVTPYLVEPTTMANLTDPSEGFVPPSEIQSIVVGKLQSAYGMKPRGEPRTLQGPHGFILD
ncbi:type II and III secretion system protein family protein [Parvularcula flava]|uniref:Pilus assembly protein CpaC n=1 Tax=Aquisalinus luteolus TaxID=1566827 RepID=A0A8J3A1Y8_9PROT|nr:type II and III secretion system protein family protein [Aquisalinus luteolus]NHK27965.1 type II and III secretion system protein family protein [Aquisalinus luteolus]GGH97067.1 pilus assembly protein CpaC [Aquisalinus luteolus]